MNTRRNHNWFAFTCCAPATAVVVLITFYPVAYAFVLSAYRTNFTRIQAYVGLGNFVRLLQDTTFLDSILRTCVFVLVSVAVSMALGYAMALLLNREMPFKGLVRALVVAPWVIAEVSAAIAWRWLLDPGLSPLMVTLRSFIVPDLDFLSHPFWAMVAVIGVSVWRFYPFPMILLLAALQTIPNEMHEAAAVDGASAWQRLLFITTPLVRGAMLIATILSTLFYFNKIVVPLVLTGGGPGQATEFMTIRLYREAFYGGNLGYASAMSCLIFMVNLVVSLLYFRVLRLEESR
jgi:multiple sugar transport system permease protein